MEATTTNGTTTTTRTVRFLGKCKGCGTKHGIERAETVERRETPTRTVQGLQGWPKVTRFYRLEGSGRFNRPEQYAHIPCACGKSAKLARVVGTFSEVHKCGAKCLASTGPTCECSCGGKNHGAAYVAGGAS